jgi:diguanylate cyclase (GGDEF)-like protein
MSVAKKELRIKNLELESSRYNGEKDSLFSTKVFISGLNFGVLGAFVNSFLVVPFYGSFSLFFGQVFVLICLVTRGLNSAVIALAISGATIAFKLDNPFLFVVLFAEMFTVHMLLKKGYFLLPSSFIFWLSIGTPLTLLFIAATSQFNADVLTISGLTHTINGLLCSSVAALVYTFVPVNSKYKRYHNAPPKFSRVIFSLCMLTVTLPTLIIALVFTWKTTNSKEHEISELLNNQAQLVSTAISGFLSEQADTISFIALALSKNYETGYAQSLLLDVTRKERSFSSMLVSEPNGRVIIAAPLKYARQLQTGAYYSLKGREYYQQVLKTQKSVVSEALSGKGFGSDPILAFISPVMRQQQLIGLVQGAIQLDQTSVLSWLSNDLIDSALYVILDKQKRVVFASESLELPILSNFDFEPTQDRIVESIPALSFRGQNYIYQSSMIENEWEVFVLTKPSAVTHVITDNFYILGASILLTLILFSLIATSLSKRLTRPLTQLSKYFSSNHQKPIKIEEVNVSRETVKLTQQIMDSKKIMLDFQHQLEHQVQEKTKQLQNLNAQLYTLAQKDGLTQILNRSGFDELANASYRNCIRNHIKVSVALFDIDFFKNINDTYGHPVGDKCIKAVADMLTQQCKRETDIIGRYGGEEFIVMLVGGQIEEHQELIKMILTKIEKMTIKADDASIKLTVSIGMSSLKKNYNMPFQDIIKSADEQLYKSKRCGRNRLSAYVQ